MMKDIQICAVVRIYKENGDYSELRYDNVSWEYMPEEDREYVASGEVLCVDLMPKVEVFYFAKPKDWSENWTELGTHTRK